MSARRLTEEFQARPPRYVLIEGPPEASDLIPRIVEPRNEPPMALLYFLAGKATNCVPLCAFSPEYQAMRLAVQLGIPVEFCDLPYQHWPEEECPDKVEVQENIDPFDIPEEPPGPKVPTLEHVWEMEVERRNPVADYVEIASAVGMLVRRTDRPCDTLREDHMVRRVRALLATGLEPADILLVCGAAHAVALVQRDLSQPVGEPPSASLPVEIFLVPYSFLRFSSVLGYGAGMRYPHLNQVVWESKDLDEAVSRVLVEVGQALNAKGHTCSTADVIDAVVLARCIAHVRGAASPGAEEIVQAVESCLTRGNYEQAGEAVQTILVGNRIGRVMGVTRTPLSEEFYRFINNPRHAPWLPLSDVGAARTLDLLHGTQRGISQFLYQLVLAGIPYGMRGDAGALGVNWIAILGPDAPEGALTPKDLQTIALCTALRGVCTLKETWTLRWTPGLEVALAENASRGARIVEVAAFRAARLLQVSQELVTSVSLFLAISRAGLEDLVLPALQNVAHLLNVSTNIRELLDVAGELFGAVRICGAGLPAPERLRELASTALARVAFLLAGSPRLPDTQVLAVSMGLDHLATVLPDREGPGELFSECLIRTAKSRSVQPALAGVAAAIAFRRQDLPAQALVFEIMDRISADSSLAGHYMEWLVTSSKEQLLCAGSFVAAMREVVMRLPEEPFIEVLPALRKGFQKASRTEIRHFLADLNQGEQDDRLAVNDLARQLNRQVDRATARLARAVRFEGGRP